MSNSKISELPVATVSNDDEIIVLDGGVTKRATVVAFKKTGWVQYSDAAVTDVAGQNIAAAGSAQLSIDGDSSIISEEPADVVSPLWNTTTDKIMPVASGDAYDVRVLFTAENYSGASPYLTIELDIGGAQNVIASVTIPLLKGGAAQKVMVPMPVFTLATFVSNGGLLRINYAGSGSVDIHSASIVIVRTHAA